MVFYASYGLTLYAISLQGKPSRVYCTASFSIRFPHDADVCYLAFHYPYTYTRIRVRQRIPDSEAVLAV